jgi:hypothetical protein
MATGSSSSKAQAAEGAVHHDPATWRSATRGIGDEDLDMLTTSPHRFSFLLSTAIEKRISQGRLVDLDRSALSWFSAKEKQVPEQGSRYQAANGKRKPLPAIREQSGAWLSFKKAWSSILDSNKL